jgi:hypothetical protein
VSWPDAHFFLFVLGFFFCLLVLLWFFFSLRQSCYVAQAGIKLVILLPQHLKCWDYRCDPPYLD